MEEILINGDRKVKAPKKQVDRIRTFFEKIEAVGLKETVKSSIGETIENFSNRVHTKFFGGKTFNESHFSKKYNKKLDKLEKKVEEFQFNLEQSTENENLKSYYDELKHETELFSELFKEDYFPNEVRKELMERLEKINEKLSNKHDNLNENEPETKEKLNAVLPFEVITDTKSIDPVNLDSSVLVTKVNEVKPKAFKKGELANYLPKIEKENIEEQTKEQKTEKVEVNVPEKAKEIIEKKDLKDLTKYTTYDEYKAAFIWNKYMKEFDSDVLERISNDFAKTINSGLYRNLYSEIQYTEIRNSQIKEKEISKINDNYSLAIKNLNDEKEKAVKETEEKYTLELEMFKQKLEDARSNVRRLNSIIKVYDEVIKSVSEISKAAGGINAIDSAVTNGKNKCDSINERYEARKQAKTEKKMEVDELEAAALAYVAEKNKNINEKNAETVKNNDKETAQKIIEDKNTIDETSSANDIVNENKADETSNTNDIVNENKTDEVVKEDKTEKENNDNILVNELSIIDKGLDEYSKLVDAVNQNSSLTDKQKNDFKNKIYEGFDEFTEQNPEINYTKVR